MVFFHKSSRLQYIRSNLVLPIRPFFTYTNPYIFFRVLSAAFCFRILRLHACLYICASHISFGVSLMALSSISISPCLSSLIPFRYSRPCSPAFTCALYDTRHLQRIFSVQPSSHSLSAALSGSSFPFFNVGLGYTFLYTLIFSPGHPTIYDRLHGHIVAIHDPLFGLQASTSWGHSVVYRTNEYCIDISYIKHDMYELSRIYNPARACIHRS